jgi:hypothetical protein
LLETIFIVKSDTPDQMMRKILFVIWCPNRTLGPLPCSADPLSPRRRPRRPSDVGAKPYVFADHLAAMLLGDQLIGYHRLHGDPLPDQHRSQRRPPRGDP